MARQIARLDVPEGDVATLSGRLAHIRTFSYAAHRTGWTADSARWQGETRAVEDRLSDALHERLTQRFIDRRTSVLMKHLREEEISNLALDESGGVTISGELIGKLDGFHFTPDPRAQGIHGRTLRAAAMRGLEGEFLVRAGRLAEAPDKHISLSEHGKLWWMAQLLPGWSRAHHRSGPPLRLWRMNCSRVRPAHPCRRVYDTFLAARIEARLEPLLALDTRRGSQGRQRDGASLVCTRTGAPAGDEFRLAGARRPGASGKTGPVLRALKPFGVWFGRRTVYLPRLLRPDAAALLALLWGVWNRQEQLPGPPAPGLTSFPQGAEPDAFLQAAGFMAFAGRAIRLDMLERLEDELEKAAAEGVSAEASLPKFVSLLGCGNEEGKNILAALGWRMVAVEGSASVWRKAKEKRRRPPAEKTPPPDSPFAVWLIGQNEFRADRQMAVPRTLLPDPPFGPGCRCQRQAPVEWRPGGETGPGHPPGDILTLPHGQEILAVRVLALAERRGPAPEARQLYEIVAD
jgi:ATP-dependent RNA helicase SUPV3L1/SUV3